MKPLILMLGLMLMLSACGKISDDFGRSTQSAACFRGDQTFQVGQKWNEDCNQCMCKSGGLVACTLKLCVR